MHGQQNIKKDSASNINKLQCSVLWRHILGAYERHNTSVQFFVSEINQKDKS